MTQPVQEPTQGRTDQGQEFRTRQLFRRPAPPPPASTAVPMWPIEPQSLLRPKSLFLNSDQFQTATSWDVSAVTADEYGSTQWEATDNGSYLIAGSRLGPYGSRWTMGYVVEKGSDCGIMKVEAWIGSEDIASWTNVPDGGLTDPYTADYEGPAPTWVQVFTADLYAAAPSTLAYCGPSSSIDWRILGADGTALTTISGTDPDTGAGVRDADGGAGPWFFRVTINGKNASSSAYRVTLRGLWVVRLGGLSGYVA